VPRIGARPLAELAPADAQLLHDALAARPVLANRCLDLLSALWRWGEGRGYVAGPNPCRTVERNEERRRSRHLTQTELGALGAALRHLVAARAVPARVAPLVRLIALTGCRPGEIKSLAWADVDLESRVLRLRDAKTGDRDVWLNSAARAVVAALADRRRTGAAASPFVFPSPRDREAPVGEFRKPWAALLEAAGIAPAPPYVLRHTFASESEAIGHSPYLTAELLGHAARRRDMTSVYVHHIGDDLRRASERIGRRIAGALDAGGGAAIVPLRRRERATRAPAS
jgi:integrase